jgi:hypothetical protein
VRALRASLVALVLVLASCGGGGSSDHTLVVTVKLPKSTPSGCAIAVDVLDSSGSTLDSKSAVWDTSTGLGALPSGACGERFGDRTLRFKLPAEKHYTLEIGDRQWSLSSYWLDAHDWHIRVSP